MHPGRANGWAPLWRCIFESEDWRNATAPTRLVMIVIIARLQHRDTATTPAGACDVRREEIAIDAGVSLRAVTDALKQLAASGWLTVTRKQVGVRIAVDGWQRWQVRAGLAPRADQGGTTCPSDRHDVHFSDAPTDPQIGTTCPSDRHDVHFSDAPTDPQIGTTCPSDRHHVPTPPYSKKIQSDPVLDLPDDHGPPGINKHAPAAPSPVPDTRQITDAFQSRFVAAYGRKPTWNAKTGKQVQALLRQHGLTRVLEAIDVLYTNPPRFLDGVLDFGTLVAHFDKLVPTRDGGRRDAAPPRGGMTSREIMARANRMARGGS